MNKIFENYLENNKKYLSLKKKDKDKVLNKIELIDDIIDKEILSINYYRYVKGSTYHCISSVSIKQENNIINKVLFKEKASGYGYNKSLACIHNSVIDNPYIHYLLMLKKDDYYLDENSYFIDFLNSNKIGWNFNNINDIHEKLGFCFHETWDNENPYFLIDRYTK